MSPASSADAPTTAPARTWWGPAVWERSGRLPGVGVPVCASPGDPALGDPTESDPAPGDPTQSDLAESDPALGRPVARRRGSGLRPVAGLHLAIRSRARLEAVLGLVVRAGRSRRDERGDVPGWVLVTLMTAGLVLVIWGVARDRLTQVFNDAIDGVVNGGR